VLDCPTRGIDVGVKANMYTLMYELKKQGKAIVMISEELPELIGMSDRILILKDGKVQKEFIRSENLSEHDIIKYMI
jgi:ribose transport system ATP-binding protein